MANYNYNYGLGGRPPVVVETYQPFQPDCGQVGRPVPFPHVGQRYPYNAGFVQTPVVATGNVVNYNGIPYANGTSPYRGPIVHPYNGYYFNHQYGVRDPVVGALGGYPLVSPCGGCDPKREILPGPHCNPGLGVYPGIYHNVGAVGAVGGLGVYPGPGGAINYGTYGVPSYYSDPRLRHRNLAYNPHGPITYPTTHSIPGPYLQSYINLPNRSYGY